MKLKKYIATACAGLIVISCSNFDHINNNTDSSTKVNSSLLATGAIMGLVKPSNGATFVDHMFVSKYLGWGEGARGEQYNEFGRVGFGGYTDLKNYRLMAELSNEQQKKSYEALSLLLETNKLYQLTLWLGDIPYSEMLKGKEGLLTPKYDSQKDIFKALIANLDRSYNLFKEGSKFDGDPIFKGDVSKWAKVATALELRILINLSKKESDADLKIKDKFREVYNRGTLMASNADNLQLVFSDKAGQIYPFHSSHNKHSGYPMLSSTMFDILKEHQDYRLFYYASPSKAKLDSGLSATDWDCYQGIDPSTSVENIKSAFATLNYCGLNDRYVNFISGEPYIIMGYAEQNFILAEGALRGWISDDPDVFYKKAIKASMDFVSSNTPDNEIYHYGRKITESVIEELLNRASIQLTGTFEQKLETILKQKYVASFMHLSYQPYFDYRRTGYPAFPINPETNKNFKEPNKIPVRWLYPDSEFSHNKANVEEALKNQYDGIDEVNKLMWILK